MRKDNISLYNEFKNWIDTPKVKDKKEINKNTKSKIFYFWYARKSTESDERQVQSIESQIGWMNGALWFEKMQEIKIFSESKSAKDPYARQEYMSLMKEIKNTYKKYSWKIKFEIHLYTWGLDRLSRNPIDSWEIQYSLQKWIITKVVCSDRSFIQIDSWIMMGIFNLLNSQFILDLQKNVKRGLKDKANKGGCIQRVPNWYINNKLTKEADVDPIIAPIIIEIFNLRDKWYSLPEIAEICKERGYKTRAKKDFSKSTIDQILKNTFYIWLQKSEWILKKWIHKKLIDTELWERVNNIKRGYVKRDTEENFPLKWIVKNYHTNKPLLALFKKWKYVYYSTHSREEIIINLNQNHIISAFDEIIHYYILPESLKPVILWMISGVFEDFYTKIENERKSLVLQINELNKKSKRIFDLVCNWTIPEEKYSEENDIITIQLNKLNEEMIKLWEKNISLNEEWEKLVELLVNLNNKWKTLDNSKKLQIIKNIVVELKVDNKKQLYIQENELFQAIKTLNNLISVVWQGV